MLLKLFRGHDPVTILIIVLTGIAVWIKPLMYPTGIMIVPDCTPMPLYGFIITVFQNRLLLSIISTLILVFVTSALLVNFNTRLFFINERTFLPASLFVLMSGLFPSLQVFNPVLPSVILLLFAVERVIGSYRRQGIAYNFFDASLLIGVASFLWFNSIWFFIVVVAGIALLRTGGLREFFLALSGLITPYILAAAIYYLSEGSVVSLMDVITQNVKAVSAPYTWSPIGIVITSVNGLILVISLVYLVTVFNTKKVKSRKTFSILIWVLVMAIATFVTLPSVSVEIYYVILFPTVYFLTHFMVFRRNKKTANILLAVLLLSVLLMQLS